MMFQADSPRPKVARILLQLGAAIFLLSLAAGVLRSFARTHFVPRVGVEYTSEIRAVIRDQGYAAALPLLRSAARIDFDNEQTALELLESARQVGDVTTSVATLQQLIRLRPEDPEIRNQFVSGLLMQGRVVEAYEHGQVAVRLNPKSALAYSNLGTALLGLGRKGEAASAYRNALRLDPTLEKAKQALEFPLRGY